MIKLSKIKPNPNNPRVIKDDKFKKLVKSIKDFPKMMELRPMVVNSDNIVLGGNMRLKALKELGYKEVPKEWVKRTEDLTKEEQKQFIIKDNVGFGEWDWEQLDTDWDIEGLNEWGLEIWKNEDIDLDDFFEEYESDDDDTKKNKIILEYTEEDYKKVCTAFDNIGGSKEGIVWNLLNLE